MSDLRIVFMGTPDFAVPSLEILAENKFNVVAVITAPDKPQGRGQKLTSSPVKESALRLGIPVLQPVSLKAPEFIDQLRALNANLQVVVAFRMLPEVVWSMPEKGTFNLHASLLPQYRGAAPINWAIINGETETGVTTFFLQHEIDTGEILFQEKESISVDDTAGMLYERLMDRGAGLVLKTTKAIAAENVQPRPQPTAGENKKAPKIFKETCEIDWNQSSEQVRNFVRGLNPHPSAWTALSGRVYKIYKVELLDKGSPGQAGKLETDGKSHISVATRDGWVAITELQPEGKKRMNAAEFLRGNKIDL